MIPIMAKLIINFSHFIFRMENQENTEIKTKRNKTELEHKDFFVFEQFNCDATKKFWRCEQFNTREVKCHGRLHTTL